MSEAIPCHCGSLTASWHGPRHGRREYCCDDCYGRRADDAAAGSARSVKYPLQLVYASTAFPKSAAQLLRFERNSAGAVCVLHVADHGRGKMMPLDAWLSQRGRAHTLEKWIGFRKAVGA